MFGYEDKRDVYADVLLLMAVGLLALLAYVVYDWGMFHAGYGSRILGLLWKHVGPESWLFEQAMRFYMLGIDRGL